MFIPSFLINFFIQLKNLAKGLLIFASNIGSSLSDEVGLLWIT